MGALICAVPLARSTRSSTQKHGHARPGRMIGFFRQLGLHTAGSAFSRRGLNLRTPGGRRSCRADPSDCFLRAQVATRSGR